MVGRIRNAIVEIRKRDLVTCKRCGCPNLAWVQYKSGKWALVETCVDRPMWRGDGPAPAGLYAQKFNYHRCEEYTAQMEEIRRRREMPHPKADKPQEILSDAIIHLVNEFKGENGLAVFATLTTDSELIQSLQILSDAIARVPRLAPHQIQNRKEMHA